MEGQENYTSLQEFTEDISSRGNKPILYKTEERQGVRGVECVRRQPILLLSALLVSIGANIVLGVLLYNGSSSSCSQVVVGNTKPSRYDTLQSRYSLLCQDYTELAKNCTQHGVKVRHCKPCPDSWLQFEGRCYYFSPDKKEWQESKESCEAMGSHLAILHSHTQHEALEKEARKLGGFDYHFWIGLSDTETEGVWKWVDNTVVNKTYWDESSSEPDNNLAGGTQGQDCAVLDSRSRSWFDVQCSFVYNRICEMETLETN